MQRIIALVFSAVIPGIGQLWSGRPAKAILILGLMAAAVFAIPFTGIVGLGLVVGVYLLQLLDAVVVTPRAKPERRWLRIGLFAAVAIALRFALVAFWGETFKNVGGGMLPTLLIGDHSYAERWDRTPRRGELIIFKYPVDPAKDFVKRVVAVAGDTVEIRSGTVIVNGHEVPRRRLSHEERYWDQDSQSERWIQRTAARDEEVLDGHTYDTFHDPHPLDNNGGYRGDFPESGSPYVVPKDTVFVLGDNRENSHDSRYWGPVPLENVKGKLLFLWWSQGGPEGIRWSRLGRRVD